MLVSRVQTCARMATNGSRFGVYRLCLNIRVVTNAKREMLTYEVTNHPLGIDWTSLSHLLSNKDVSNIIYTTFSGSNSLSILR